MTQYKPFDELEHDELIALDNEQINYYIDRECAEAGVPLLPPTPPVQPQIEQIAKSVTHYVIAGMRFLNASEAANICKAIQSAGSRRTTQYVGSRWSYSGPQHDAPADDEMAVSIDYVHTADEAARQKAANEAKAEIKAAFDSAKKEYDAAVEGRERLAERVRSTVGSAWKTERRRQSLKAEYERYLPLANGDEQVAKRFLQRAHSDAREVLPALFPEGWNDEPARAADAPVEELAF